MGKCEMKQQKDDTGKNVLTKQCEKNPPGKYSAQSNSYARTMDC